MIEENNNLEKKEPINIFEKCLLFSKNFPVTSLIIFVCLILFALVNFNSFYFKVEYHESLFKFGAGVPFYYWQGEIWRLFVNTFHHGNLMHIGFNLYGLYFLGSITERIIGSFKYFVFIVLSSLFCGIIGTLTIEPFAIGISGFLYGIVGFLIVVRNEYPFLKVMINKEFIQVSVFGLFFFIVLTYLDIFNIANVAHFTGFIYGLIFGYLLYIKTNLLKKIVFGLINLLIIPSLIYIYSPIYDSDWQKYQKYKNEMLNIK